MSPIELKNISVNRSDTISYDINFIKNSSQTPKVLREDNHLTAFRTIALYEIFVF